MVQLHIVESEETLYTPLKHARRMLHNTIFMFLNIPNVLFTIPLFLSRHIFTHFAYPTHGLGLFNNPVPRLTKLCSYCMVLRFKYRFSPLARDEVFTIEPIAAHK